MVGTVGAVSINQKLRREGTVARSIEFVRIPATDGRPARVRISFRLAESDTVDVAVVDADGEPTRVLADSAELEGDDAKHRFFWDLKTEDGEPAPPGRYRLRLALEDADRVATSGERLSVKPAPGSP